MVKKVKFKVGISGDLINSDGKPCFGKKSLEKFYNRRDIDLEWMDAKITEISQDMSAKFDAILLNLPKATKRSVERKDCRLKIISRFGVGYDSVDIEEMKKKKYHRYEYSKCSKKTCSSSSFNNDFCFVWKIVCKRPSC